LIATLGATSKNEKKARNMLEFSKIFGDFETFFLEIW
jgi:hypothetical protein